MSNLVFNDRRELRKYLLENDDKTMLPSMKIKFNNCDHLFAGKKHIVSIQSIDMDGVVSAVGMFAGCTNLMESPRLFNTQSLTNTTTMFYKCENLTTVHKFDCSNVEHCKGMFYNCNRLNDIPDLVFPKVTEINQAIGMLGGTKFSKYVPEFLKKFGKKMGLLLSDRKVMKNIGTVLGAGLGAYTGAKIYNGFYKSDDIKEREETKVQLQKSADVAKRSLSKIPDTSPDKIKALENYQKLQSKADKYDPNSVGLYKAGTMGSSAAMGSLLGNMAFDKIAQKLRAKLGSEDTSRARFVDNYTRSARDIGPEEIAQLETHINANQDRYNDVQDIYDNDEENYSDQSSVVTKMLGGFSESDPFIINKYGDPTKTLNVNLMSLATFVFTQNRSSGLIPGYVAQVRSDSAIDPRVKDYINNFIGDLNRLINDGKVTLPPDFRGIEDLKKVRNIVFPRTHHFSEDSDIKDKVKFINNIKKAQKIADKSTELYEKALDEGLVKERLNIERKSIKSSIDNTKVVIAKLEYATNCKKLDPEEMYGLGGKLAIEKSKLRKLIDRLEKVGKERENKEEHKSAIDKIPGDENKIED